MSFCAACRCSPVRCRCSVPATPRTTRTSCSPPGSRAASLAGTQSRVLDDPADLERALAAAARTVENDPGTVSAEHTVYAVTATTVEFRQGDADRRHVRLRYRRDGHTWVEERLWP